MFLRELQKRNKKLIEFTKKMHENGTFEPNSYIIDLDSVKENAKLLFDKSKKLNINLYQMTKQFGRNPMVSKAIYDVGIKKAVCVDWTEAETMNKNGIEIGNVGHVVQVPISKIPKILNMSPEVWTVYTLEEAKKINNEAINLNINQKIIVRVYIDENDLYESQKGGINISNLKNFILEFKNLKNLNLVGLTSFPVIQFSVEENKEVITNNYEAIKEGIKIFKECGIEAIHINTPSANNMNSLDLISSIGGTHAEPGHAFTGTTPISDYHKNIEKPAILYLSEVSHIHNDNVVIFSGGHYRRGRQKEALINDQLFEYIPQPAETLSYYYDLKINDNKIPKKGDTVIMAFRTQIFVTRAKVIVVSGLQKNEPVYEGIFSALGEPLNE